MVSVGSFSDAPSAYCPCHGLLETSLVSRWYQHSGMGQVTLCPHCMVLPSWDSFDAVWDGSQWQTDRLWDRWRDDWCRQTERDIELAGQLWSMVMEHRASSPHALEPVPAAFLLLEKDPDLGAAGAWDLVNRAKALRLFQELEDGNLRAIRRAISASSK